jgi:hypothetical protein
MRKATIDLLLGTLQLRDGLTGEQARGAWLAIDTEGLEGLVRYEGAEIWLYRRLQQVDASASAGFMAALRNEAHRSQFNNMRIDAQTATVTAMLDGAGIPWALLKGQARRAAESRYLFAASRPVSDVDLLLPESYAEQAWHLLLDRGFRRLIEGPVDWRADHHLPTLIDSSNVSVELHTTTGRSVAPAEAWRRATERADIVTWNDVRTSVPNATELVWQALSHGVADGVRGFHLKAFLSIAAILAECPSIEWTMLEARLANNEVLDNETGRPSAHERVVRFLGVAAELSGTTLPEALVPRSRADLRPLLRWRGRVLRSRFSEAVRDRLLEEASRKEAMLPIAPAVRGRGLMRAVRRRLSSVVARSCYVAWRMTQ